MDWVHRLYEGRESFNDREEEIAYREKLRAHTRNEAYALCELVHIPPGSRILDAYCGNGRHAIEFAIKGFETIGFDISSSRIAFAHRWARDLGVNAYFLVTDGRNPGLRPPFSAIFILGGSFSYSQDEMECIYLLKVMNRLLSKSGLLLIDNPNPIRFWRYQNPDGSFDEENELKYFDLLLGKNESHGYVRYYNAHEMKRLFMNAGFSVRQIFGDRQGRPYNTKSPRLIVIGEKTN
jgi:SAM-dependent methyltransferase